MTGVLSRTQGTPTPSEATATEMIVSQIESLPTLPSVAMKLLELTSDAGSSAREVIRLVESDQSIAARILSLVRRAHLGTNVTSVERAVVALGFDAVRCLVLSMQVFEAFSDQTARAGGELDVAGLWKHSLAVGCAAKLLAEELARGKPGARSAMPAPKPEEAFLCGLLHDVGKVALYVCFPKSYDRVVRSVESRRNSIGEEEQQVFGLDHTVAGRRLAMHWKLPGMIAESAWLHHQTPASTPTRIAFPAHVQMVQVADRLARQMHIGYSGNFLHESTAQLGIEAGLTAEAIDRVMSAMPELIEERAELIGLDRLTSRELYQSALIQANAELGRLGAKLSIEHQALGQRARCLDAINSLNEAAGEDATHEEILTAANAALQQLHPESRVCTLVVSASRGVVVLKSSDEKASPEVRPLEPGWLPAVTQWGQGWASASLLPPIAVDACRGLLGESPRWCWALRQKKDWLGVFILAGPSELEPDTDSGVQLLARVTSRLLSTAEAAVRSRQLHEELAMINSRLLSAQSELARMRSVAMIGEMAAGAAHELNNPLAVISGRAQLLNREGMSDEVRKNAGLISEHAHRASQIVTELMEFAKPATPAPDSLDLAGLLGQGRQTWITTGPLTAAQIELRVSDDLPRVWADEAQIRILFDEIVRNAIEATSSEHDARVLINCGAHPTDDKVVISIQDNGRGMSAEVLESAATPFFSHRSAGRGRGLGLSRAVRYAEINGGHLRLDSRPGRGTQVIIELPRAKS